MSALISASDNLVDPTIGRPYAALRGITVLAAPPPAVAVWITRAVGAPIMPEYDSLQVKVRVALSNFALTTPMAELSLCGTAIAPSRLAT